MSKDVKEMLRRITTCRVLNLFICLVCPKLSLLDSYFVDSRIQTYAHITKRGRFRFYDMKRVKKIVKMMRNPARNIKQPTPMFEESFRDCKNVYPKLWKAYLKKKVSSVLKRREETKPRNNIFTIGTSQLAKSIPTSVSDVKLKAKLMKEGEHFVWVTQGTKSVRKFCPRAYEFWPVQAKQLGYKFD